MARLSPRVGNHHSASLKMLSRNSNFSTDTTPPGQRASWLSQDSGPPGCLPPCWGRGFQSSLWGYLEQLLLARLRWLPCHLPALPRLLALYCILVKAFRLLFGTSYLCFPGGQMCKAWPQCQGSQVVPLSQRVLLGQQQHMSPDLPLLQKRQGVVLAYHHSSLMVS